MHAPADEAAPARTAENCARAFVALVNDPTPDRVRNFEKTWASRSRLDATPIEERIPRIKTLVEEWGTVSITSVSTDGGGAVLEATSSEGLALELTMNMSKAEPDKLDTIDVAISHGHADARELTADTRTQTVKGVAEALRTGYVFPEKGAAMADAILAKLSSGEYDSIKSEAAFARRLTEDCRAITSDKHLGVRLDPARPVSSEQEGHAGPSHDEMRRENYGFKKVELLPGNIGYLRFDVFVEDEEARRVASNAMNFLSGADAIIFDLRTNGGGSPDMIRYITSYLFDSKTHLNDMVDRDGNTVEEYWTLDDVPGPRPKADVPVYVLTSSRTFSGAEEFSYNLKNLKRATLVGETTGGGAHPVRGERINDRFMVRVPFMRAQNPITKTNWEGAGVEPDIKTPAKDALDRAVELAREAVHHD
jgi:hypothetical protein